jgi:pimeloyl-ACP methyl ester carboxylesterase
MTASSSFKDRFCQIEAQYLRYWEFGCNNSRKVILLHGIGAAIECWETLIPILSRSFHVYAFDFLGFGQSDKPKISYSPNIYVESVVKFIQYHNIKKCSLIGHSMGGEIALLYALAEPMYVEKIVLLSSAGLGRVSIWLRLAATPTMLALLSTLLSHPRMGAVFFSYIYGMHFTVNSLSKLSQYWNDPLVAYAFASYIQSIKNERVIDNLESLEKACLAIWGKNDYLVPIKHAHVAQKLLQQCNLHIIEGGHGAYSQNPEEVNSLILEFLKD